MTRVRIYGIQGIAGIILLRNRAGAPIFAWRTVLDATISESGIAGNRDSEDIPGGEITKDGSDKPKTGGEGLEIPHIPRIPARNEARRLFAEEV